MLKTEVERIFTLMGQFWPNASQLKSKQKQAAWVMALEPYDYEDAKNSVVAYARKNQFFPDVFSITAGLKEVHIDTPKNDPGIINKSSEIFPYVVKLYSQISEEKRDEYHAAGVPTYPEAEAAGMGWKDWTDQCRRAFGGNATPPSECNRRFRE